MLSVPAGASAAGGATGVMLPPALACAGRAAGAGAAAAPAGAAKPPAADGMRTALLQVSTVTDRRACTIGACGAAAALAAAAAAASGRAGPELATMLPWVSIDYLCLNFIQVRT
jgi:hypothetical protein